MKCLVYCPDNYLRQAWDYCLRQQKNLIFHYGKTLEEVQNMGIDRVIFCEEHLSLKSECDAVGVSTLFAGKKQVLKFKYNCVYFWREIREIVDTAFSEKTIPSQFSGSDISKIMPIIFNAIIKGKKGLHQLADEKIYSGEEVANFYNLSDMTFSEPLIIKSNQEIKGFKDMNFKEKATVNIYIPTYYRLEKTKKSIITIAETAQKSQHDIRIYIGDNNTKLPEMRDWLKKIEFAVVYLHPENIGKANMVNLLHEKARSSDYIFSIDSDMIVENQPYHPFDHMIKCLERCDNIGLVSSQQKDCNQHWFGRGVDVLNERGFDLGYSPNWVGVAGGCICMRKSDWKEIGGYKKNHDIYTGDDGILTYNVARKLNKRVVVDMQAFLLHPKPTEEEKGYTEWKAKSWQRDGLKFIKDSYQGSNRKGYYD